MSDSHSFVTPAPAGLAALAVACFGFGAIFLGQVTLAGYPLLAAWLIGGGIVQYTTAVIELKDGNITGGNVFLFFAAFFMFGAALSLISKFLIVVLVKQGLIDAALFDLSQYKIVEGWCWMVGASFLTIVTPAYIKSSPKPLLGIVVLLDIALWIIAFLDMRLLPDPDKFWHHVVAYLLIASGCLGIYLSGAIVNNAIYGKIVMPLFTPPEK